MVNGDGGERRLPRRGTAARWRPALAILALAIVLAMPARVNAQGGREQDAATRALAALNDGVRARRDGNLLAACDHFTRAVALTPTWAAARFELARCLRLIGDPGGRASEHLEEAIRMLPDRAALRIERARLLEDRGDTEGALALYAEAQRLMPGDVRTFRGLARLSPPGQGRMTIARLKQVLARQPRDVATWRRLAEVAEAAGALGEAEDALRTALELTSNKRATAALLARFAIRTKRTKALETARRILAKGK